MLLSFQFKKWFTGSYQEGEQDKFGFAQAAHDCKKNYPLDPAVPKANGKMEFEIRLEGKSFEPDAWADLPE